MLILNTLFIYYYQSEFKTDDIIQKNYLWGVLVMWRLKLKQWVSASDL